MIKSNLQGCTKDLTSSAQEQSIGSNYIKCNIDKNSRSFFFFFFFFFFGICGTKNETISHRVSEC